MYFTMCFFEFDFGVTKSYDLSRDLQMEVRQNGQSCVEDVSIHIYYVCVLVVLSL